MADDSGQAATEALKGLVATVAHDSARVAHEMGVEFDVDDPRVARWLMLATFEGMFMRSSRTTSKELLVTAEKASEGEGRIAPLKKRKGERSQSLITWDDLVASVEAGSGQEA